MLLLAGLVVLLVGIACGANGSNLGRFDEFSVLDSGYIYIYAHKNWSVVSVPLVFHFCSISLETSIFGYDHFVKEIMQDSANFINCMLIPNFSSGLSFLNMFYLFIFIYYVV